MAISLVGSANTDITSDSLTSVTLPSGLQDGDLLIVALCRGSTGSSYTSITSGWTHLVTESAPGKGVGSVFYKVSNGTETAFEIDWFGTDENGAAIAIAFRSDTLFLDTPIKQYSSKEEEDSGLITTTALADVGGQNLVLALWATQNAGFTTTFATPSGYTHIGTNGYSYDSSPTLYAYISADYKTPPSSTENPSNDIIMGFGDCDYVIGFLLELSVAATAGGFFFGTNH